MPGTSKLEGFGTFLMYYCIILWKKLLVSFTTTLLKANSAIIFGRAISPLKISAIVQTAADGHVWSDEDCEDIKPAIDFYML